MIKKDEDALICDLAETYGIFDYKRLSLRQVAVFSYGLKDDSRIKLQMRNTQVPIDLLLKASIVDQLRWIVWSKTEDSQKGRNRPESLVDLLQGKVKVRSEQSFESGEEFLREREKLLKRLRGDTND